MEAKKTLYNDYLFRSKLEAKWAVFFDMCFIPFIYEPESFLCEDGSQYTPDFFLPEVELRTGHYFDVIKNEFVKIKPGVFIEIKPLGFAPNDEFIKRLSSAIYPNPLILLVGDPVSAINDSQKNIPVNNNEQISPFWDNNMVFMHCPKCGKFKIEFDEGNYYICNHCGQNINGVELNDYAVKARNFRFQFYNLKNK